MANSHYLICTDLDRTLLPNGAHPESAQGMALFAKIAAREDVDVAYVTGRHHALVLEAIAEFQIPIPDFVIGDVGSSLYEIRENNWQQLPAWKDEIAPCWAGVSHHELIILFEDLKELRLQPVDKQSDFKLSYFAPENCDRHALLNEMQKRLDGKQIKAHLNWSIDDLEHIGLLDILPINATKLHAIEFLISQKSYQKSRVVFSGDSGNDMPVLSSPINATLVANARDDVRKEAIQQAKQQGNEQQLYLAKGNIRDMNGNYSAGIVEGILHYLPTAHSWL
ncbi:HAD-IIB family hydrolase [Pseudomonadota bacterium]